MLNSKLRLKILGSLRDMKGKDWLKSLTTAVLCTQFVSLCRDLGYKTKDFLVRHHEMSKLYTSINSVAIKIIVKQKITIIKVMVLLNYIKACNMSWWVILPLQMEALEEVTLYYHGEGISKPFRNRKTVNFSFRSYTVLFFTVRMVGAMWLVHILTLCYSQVGIAVPIFASIIFHNLTRTRSMVSHHIIT